MCWVKRILGLLLLLWLAGAVAASGVAVTGAWIREGPPGAPSLAGYMVIQNPATESRILVGARSPAFANVMLHRTVVEKGMARMAHQERVTVPAGGRVVFEPDSYHLMLMGPDRRYRVGDQVEVVLEFANGETVAATFDVRAGMGAGSGHMH